MEVERLDEVPFAWPIADVIPVSEQDAAPGVKQVIRMSVAVDQADREDEFHPRPSQLASADLARQPVAVVPVERVRVVAQSPS
jgi:hypothetical protein